MASASYYNQDDGGARPPSRRSRDHSPDYPSGRRSRDSFVREAMHLEPPPGYSSSSRTRSVPPSGREVVPRGRSPSLGRYDDDLDDGLADDDDYRRHLSRSFSSSRSRRGSDRDDSPLNRARSVVNNNFSHSGAGLGAGLVGAIAGGFAARQVSDRVSHRKDSHGKHRRRSDADRDERIRLATTILGAAIGGLGANALTKHYENTHDREGEKDRARQHAWEDSYGRDDDDLPRYESRHSSRRNLTDRDYDDYDDDYDQVYDRRRENKRLPSY